MNNPNPSQTQMIEKTIKETTDGSKGETFEAVPLSFVNIVFDMLEKRLSSLQKGDEK